MEEICPNQPFFKAGVFFQKLLLLSTVTNIKDVTLIFLFVVWQFFIFQSHASSVVLLRLQVCLVGKSRNYAQLDEAEVEQQRARYVQSRQAAPGVTVQVSHSGNDGNCCQGNEVNGRTPGSSWGAGFQPRNRVEMVRNCAALPRDFIDSVVLQVANALLGMTKEECDWNRGGKTRQTHNTPDNTQMTQRSKHGTLLYGLA